MKTRRLLLVLVFAFAGFGFVQPASASILDALSNNGDDPSLAPMLDKVMPSVVSVLITPEHHQRRRNPLFQNPFFRRFFGRPEQRKMPDEPQPVGSGVIVDADDGIVLTNNHVVAHADEVWVGLRDDRRIKAKILGTDPQSDLAVLKIKADNLNAIPMADSDELRVGDFVVAIGNPFGLKQTVTSGIVSALGRHGLGNRYENFIQTDAAINPGNSGGALVNMDGELVGINTAILSKSGGNIGIGFAIPVNLAKKVMHQIREYGEIRRGRLGVIGQNLTNALAKAMDMEITQGVLIAKVIKDSPAAKAGIQEGDVITKVEGTRVENFSDLATTIGLRPPGQTISITLIRDGETVQVSPTLTKASKISFGAGSLFKGLSGAKFGTIPADHPLAGQIQGVAVTRVAPGSPAARAGLRPGDIITSVNRKQVDSLKTFRQLASKEAEQLLLHIRRGNGALFLLIE